MALTTRQSQAISLLSDTVLYPEAVAFIRQLVQEEECNPLPTSQVTGLLNVAASAKYSELYRFVLHQRDRNRRAGLACTANCELYRFVLHQRDRNWPPSRSDIKKFYTALEKYLTTLHKKRLKDEFHLTSEGLSNKDANAEAEVLMARLAQEFIQHLVAENGLLAVERASRR